MVDMDNGSIYERIRFCIELIGYIPTDFVLEKKEYKEKELRFAPGAMEGILGHHFAGASEKSALTENLEMYFKLLPEDALELFERQDADRQEVAASKRALQKAVYEHKGITAEKVYAFALTFAGQGMKIESVKLGLCLLALLNLERQQEEVYPILRCLGCCEEFTGYVLDCLESFPEKVKQDLYFEYAKRLDGWGKINAVERMEADTEEKKEWILCHGCRNSVMNAYLGYICAVKCDFFKRLEQGNLNEEEFRGAMDIMEGLLDEGPCEGLSAMENAADLVLLYLEECKKHPLDVDVMMLLADIREYFGREAENLGEDAVGDSDSRKNVLEKVEVLLVEVDLPCFVAENMKEKTHQCIRIANEFGVCVSGELIDLMRQDFSKYYVFCYYLFQREEYVDEFFWLCEQQVKESDYPNEMGDSWGFGGVHRGIGLDMIVQYLDRYPLCGKKMIRICLHSPITRWRNMAGKALLGWVKELGGTLADIDRNLYEIVEDVASRECNEGTKETWKRLLG